ncbi:GDSL-like Lipase/Acylhydrolase superfamily protein [Heracleum sosnowskyi]|uniref:GDSL-like Lipase/Acylhydrolase superfamily protein n=1 Tax=Heracleum sosnowskyi TaxID=360622 RepID=A0AAD8HT95_9APIA|nr:GDSL-like Lipase/Acylhydrolase superfamily protein [Heracleum sosnowskyi]
MAPMNLLPSMLSIYLCFNFLLFSCSSPTKIFANAERNGNDSTIKGMFVFGDSFLDNGNNNFLETIAKADYLPYGMDSPLGPSGRFSNGKNFIDVLGELLNISTSIPAFLDPSTKGNHTSVGVTFASGGSGILNESGNTAGGSVPSLDEQIKNFEEITLPELQSQGETSSRKSLSKYLFVIGCGSNDYVLNYFRNGSESNISVQDFTANLTTNLSSHLKKLYNLGAQKIVLMSLYPIGCSPLSIAAQPAKRKGCNKSHNEAALLFNAKLKAMVKGIRPQKPGPNVVMVNGYKIVRDIIRNPASNGFVNANESCCKVLTAGEGRVEARILCEKGGSTCEDRKKQVYFDGFHLTEAVNVILATKAFGSNLTTDAYPFSISKLAQI